MIYGHWSLGYLKDEELKLFLARCRSSLLSDNGQKNGLMIVKESITENNDEPFQQKSQQNMIVRSQFWYTELFEKHGFKVL